MIKLKNMSKIYKMGDVELKALDDVSLNIVPGEFVAIMGPSGSGKSTLMNMIGFLDVPTSGTYIIDDKNTQKLSDNELAEIRNDKIGFVFQSFNLLSNLTAQGNVELPLIYSSTENRSELSVKSLNMVGLGERKHHRPKELSGGQQQRVAIARALVNQPSLIMADEPTGALDSKTGDEIMKLLQDLNEKGITIILVTHEKNIADYAKRVIILKDGKIVSDQLNDHAKDKKNIGIDRKNFKKTRKRSWMSKHFLGLGEVMENFLMAVYSIFSNKMRTFLTMLGVIIGVASVIGMTAIGSGAQKQVIDNISSMGANLLMVYPGAGGHGPVRSSAGRQNLKIEDGEALQEKIDDVNLYDVSYSRNAQVVYENNNTNTRINGVSINFPQVNNFEVASGTFFKKLDDNSKRRVAVLGNSVKEELFGDKDPIGEYIKIRRINFQVIGVLKEKGASGWRDEDDLIVVPIQTAQKRLFGQDFVNIINLSLKDDADTELVEKQVTEILRKRHKIPDGAENDFNVRSMAEIIDRVGSSIQSFTFLLAGIAVVSLVVGGIGIMNIMLVSVTERTREIGIRKAIGARRIDILAQFLIEAILVSLSGGLTGIGIGYGISYIVETFFKFPAIISMNSVMTAFLFSVAVGLFFGFYPARKASKLNPIDALRYE